MSQKILEISQFSVRESKGALEEKAGVGIDFDEVLLHCEGCKKTTLHNYSGFKSESGQTIYNYRCKKCKKVYTSDRRL